MISSIDTPAVVSEAEEELAEMEEEEASEVDLDEVVDAEESPIVEGDENEAPSVVLAVDGEATSNQRAQSMDLPIAVTRRIMKAAAANRRLTPELIGACARSAGVFALYLLSACQDAATDAGRTTIRPIEVVQGLLACGFPELAEEVRVSMNIQMVSKKKKVGRKK